MARKPKAKRLGRPPLAKEIRREGRSVRLPQALWAELEAYGEVTATIERAVKEFLLDRTDNQPTESRK